MTTVAGRPDGETPRGLRLRVASTTWRRRLAKRRSTDLGYRALVAVVGALVVALGLLTIPLPGPGWLTVIGGLVVLATEFTWAERLLAFTRAQIARWSAWVGRQPVWVRAVFAVLTIAVVYGVVAVVLHLVGVPSWVPGWVPLWR